MQDSMTSKERFLIVNIFFRTRTVKKANGLKYKVKSIDDKQDNSKEIKGHLQTSVA